MQVTWFGQSAFLLEGPEGRVAIDPFADLGPLAARGLRFAYPPIEGVEADLVLVTHEHLDHNGIEAIGGSPGVIRSTAGRLQSPVGEIVAVASEHDPKAGTDRGPNSLMRFMLDGVRVCHLGDLGQAALRDEQVAALGVVDLLFVPVGGGPTLDAAGAAAAVERLAPRWVVPMHYRTAAIDFLEPADAFLASFGERVVRCTSPSFDTAQLDTAGEPVAVVPAIPT